MSKTQILRGPCESMVDTQIINLHQNVTNGCLKNTTATNKLNGIDDDVNADIISDNNNSLHKHKKNIFIDNNFKYIDTDNDDEPTSDDVINVNGIKYDDNPNDHQNHDVIKHKAMDFRNQHRSYKNKDTNILSTPIQRRSSPTIAKTTVLKCNNNNNNIKPIADLTTPSLSLSANMCNGKYSDKDDLYHQQRNVVYSIQNTINNCMNTTKTQNQFNDNNQNQNQTTTKISGKLNGCNKDDDDHVVNEQKHNNGNGRHIIYNSNNVRNNNEIQQRNHSNDNKVYANNNKTNNTNNINNKNKCDVKQQMDKNEQSDVDLIKINTSNNNNNNNNINNTNNTNNNNNNNISKKNINDKLIEHNILKTKNKINSARKNNVNGGGAILDNVLLMNGVENEDEDDPYIQLEEYLDKVNREINEVFEQFRLSDKLTPVSPVPDRNNNKLLPEQKCKKSKDIIADDKITIEKNMNQKQQQQQQQQQEAEVKRTTEWANTILKELDNLMKADKHCTDRRNDVADGDGDGGKQLATTPIKSIDTTLTNNKIIQNNIINNNNNNNILKPEKHIYIPLQSFSLKDSLLESTSQKNRSKTLTIEEIRNQQQQQSHQPVQQKLSNPQNEKLSALRIEEDRCTHGTRDLTGGPFNHHKLIESKDIFTQTDPINYVHRKGSTSTIWTSDESILRSTDNVDEDNKSSSSSDEPSALLLSSSKSGNSLDSSELDNDNTESGIGTSSPPKEKESYRWNGTRKQTQSFLLNSNKQTWVRRESVQTQTNPVTIQPVIKIPKNFSMDSNANEPDLLEVLSLFEVEGTEDFECIEDESNLNSTSKPPPITRIRTIQDTYYNNNDDITNNNNNNSNNNNNNNNSDDVQLRNKSLKYSTLLSTKQSHQIKSNASSRNVSSYPVNYQSDNAVQVINNRSVYDSLPLVRREAYGSYDKKYTNDILASQQKRPFCLPIGNPDAYLNNNMMELPSPSSASLHSGLGNIGMQELTTKSSSAPILLKKEKRKDDFGFGPPQMNLRYSRSQSDRYLAEIEAIEACKWLRAAGFPQYAQMYEDLQFPIDLSNVAKDHPFLENDPLQSLYRRLVALNKSASMRLDSAYKHGNKEDSEDDEYALSENWTFQKNIRRWSRVDEMGMDSLPTVPVSSAGRKSETILSRDSSPDHTDSDNIGFSTLPIGATFANNGNSTDSGANDQLPVRFRRTGSERLKDGAKAILRRVESIKSRRRKRQNREGVIISGPQVLDLPHMNQKINDLKCVDIVTMSTPPSPVSHNSFLLSPNYSINTNNINNNNNITVHDSKLISGRLSPNRLSPVHHQHPHHYGTLQQSHSANHSTTQLFHHNRTSPLHFFSHPSNSLLRDFKSGDETSSYCSDGSQDSSAGGVGIVVSGGGGGDGSGGLNSGSPFLEVTGGNGGNIIKKRPSRTRRFLQGGSKVEDIGALSDSECHHARRKQRYFKDSTTANTNTNINGNGGVKVTKIARGGSLNLGKESQRYREAFRSRSFRSKSSTAYRKDKGSESDRDDDVLIRSSRPTVVRWHSFRSSHERPDIVFKKCFATRTQDFTEGTPFEALSAGQLQVVRKLALVTLTGYMERYCPTHRTGWNWELPKFIKKIKTPDYKDKKIFGVPLLLTLQRTGQTLPKSIQNALKWLKLNALDQVGLFRKPGVKSRIHNLKTIIEQGNVTDEIAVYDQQQAFDVADMVKQYFRELPDTLLTAKLSETFIAIFLHLPAEVRQDALQSAVLLLPDEHREVLQYILEFLNNVADNASCNQMTANNLAVCFAPSLFHGGLTNIRQNSVSPRRRKPIGIPDSRELAETRASHDCLTYLIQHYRTIFSISIEKMSHCNFGYMEESRPVPLEALGEGLQVHDWRGYLYECTSATIKEGREKSRSWISTSSFDSNVDIAYKKVGDGHPLRLWKCTTEVEAPPLEVLQYIFKERHLWDTYLLKWRIIEQLDERSEIFQYANGGQTITDYCVLRSWRSDLPRGACVIVETSVDHADATLLLGGVRGVVLASRYLIEPCGSGRSRIMHLARVDTKGRTPEWYNKSYGHICSHYLTKIRNSFKHITTGPESKV